MRGEGRGERGERRGERDGSMRESIEQITVTGADYTATWNKFRCRRRWANGALAGGFAMLMIAFFFNTSILQAFTLAIGMILMPVFLINQFRVNYFRCPRCGRHFFIRFLINDIFARRCVHCGLPKWAKDDSQEENS
jgi:hypothetical protein